MVLDGRLRDVTISHFKLLIVSQKVYLTEICGIIKLVKHVIYPQKYILILNGNLIQLVVINAYLRDPSFFCTNGIGAPLEETLDLMNPLSNKSFDCSFYSFNSVWAILYRRTEIACILGRTQILKSISLSGGTLGSSSGKSLGNSLTIRIYSRDGVSKLSSITQTKWQINYLKN